jgi:hypothetical protein
MVKLTKQLSTSQNQVCLPDCLEDDVGFSARDSMRLLYHPLSSSMMMRPTRNDWPRRHLVECVGYLRVHGGTLAAGIQRDVSLYPTGNIDTKASWRKEHETGEFVSFQVAYEV